MKKLLAIMLSLVIACSFCACGANDKQEVNREVVSIYDLIDSLDNLARAEQNVGKATHLFGTVESIGAESFTLNHLFIGENFDIHMQTSDLIELNKGDFISIYAIIDNITEGGGLEFIDCKKAEMELMDDYVIDAVSSYDSETLLKTHSDIISDYVTYRDNVFKMTNDKEIASYIVGKWYNPYHMGMSGTFISITEYFEDGEGVFQSWDSYFNEWDDSYCSWSVENGVFNGSASDATPVYKITENAMVTANELHIRAN